jgi:hypothetical protein
MIVGKILSRSAAESMAKEYLSEVLLGGGGATGTEELPGARCRLNGGVARAEELWRNRA